MQLFCFYFALIIPRIDASNIHSGWGRYINHLKRGGNLRHKVIVDEEQGKPHLCFFANREIKIGDDLYYDYGERDPEIIKENPWLKDYMKQGMVDVDFFFLNDSLSTLLYKCKKHAFMFCSYCMRL